MSIAKKLPEIACTAGEKMQIETTATKHAARIETRTTELWVRIPSFYKKLKIRACAEKVSLTELPIL